MEAWSVGFSPDGKHIATGSHSGKINVWTVESGEKDRVLDTKSKFVMSCVYVSSLWNFFAATFYSVILVLNLTESERTVSSSRIRKRINSCL